VTTIRPDIIIEKYSVITHQAEEGGYWAEVIELPGCVSQGETEVELIQNIREAIQAVLEAKDEEPPVVFLMTPRDEIDTFKFYSDEPRTWTAGH